MRIGNVSAAVLTTLIGFNTNAEVIEKKSLLNQKHVWPQVKRLIDNQTEQDNIVDFANKQNSNVDYRLIKVIGDEKKYEHYQVFINDIPLIDSQFVLFKNKDNEIVQALGKVFFNINDQQVFKAAASTYSQSVQGLNKALSTLSPESLSKPRKVFIYFQGAIKPALQVTATFADRSDLITVDANTYEVLKTQKALTPTQSEIKPLQSTVKNTVKSAVNKFSDNNSDYIAGGGIGGNEKMGQICFSPSPSSMKNCMAYQFDVKQFEYFSPTLTAEELIFSDRSNTSTPLIFSQYSGYPFVVRKEGNVCFTENPYVQTIDLFIDTNQTFSYNCGAEGENFDVTEVDSMYYDFLSFSPVNDAHFYGGLSMQYYHKMLNELFPDQASSCSLNGYCIEQLKQKVNNNIWGFTHAFWNGTHTNYSIGDYGLTHYSFTTLNIVAHESAHAITHWNSGLKNEGDSGAFNEAFSDIATLSVLDYLQRNVTGSFAESKAFKEQTSDGSANPLTDKKWWLGWDVMSEELYEGFEGYYDYIATRFFALPSANGKDIEHMSDYDATLSHHSIGGVFRKAFYELVKTKSWSIENAFKLFLRANIACLSPNLSFNESATCLYDQAEFINPNNSVAQAKRDVDEVLHSVGLVAQSSGLSSLDLDINLLYNKIIYRQSTLNKQDIAQIDIEWGDGEVETWSSTDNTAVQPYLEREKMLLVDKLGPFKITVTTTSGDVKVAYRHYYTRAVGVAFKPYIANEQTTLTGSLSINDTTINIATQAYQQILDQTIEVQQGTSNTWSLDNTFDGQNATILLDANRDGIFSRNETYAHNVTVKDGQVTFIPSVDVTKGQMMARFVLGNNYQFPFLLFKGGDVSAGQVFDIKAEVINSTPPDVPLSANFTYEVQANNVVKFTNVPSVNNSSPESYNWNIENGTTISHQTPHQTSNDVDYAHPGRRYRTDLQIVHNDGVQAFKTKIKIEWIDVLARSLLYWAFKLWR